MASAGQCLWQISHRSALASLSTSSAVFSGGFAWLLQEDMTVGTSNRAGVVSMDRHGRHRSKISAGTLPVYSGPFGPVQAERLLWRAGFGPRPGEAARLAKLGLRGAVRSLTHPGSQTLTGPPPVLQDGQPIEPESISGHEVLWWLDRMVRSNTPLIERMTLIWHDWFATSNAQVDSQPLMIAQNETLRRLCLSDFGELLRTITIDPAMIRPHSIASLLQNDMTATVTVWVFELVSMKAKRNSFHEKMKQNMAQTAIPGAASGKVTLQNVVHTPWPSTWAAIGCATTARARPPSDRTRAWVPSPSCWARCSRG